jgi:hydroxymethylpyrimidine pyrophosphatase-like HAD family hydrolase
MVNKIQMIVTDLDKSLLQSDKTISDYTKNVFKKCRDKNIITAFATAGPIRSTNQKTIKILKEIEKNYPESTLSAEINDVLYTNFDTDAKLGYRKIDFAELPDIESDKIIIGNMSIEKIKEIEKYITDDLYLEINDGRFGFIQNKKASKWNGVKKLSKHYKIRIEEIIAFGDDLNDLEMIQNCGIGIAMENGLEEVKSTADYICKNNDNDGIAEWIEEKIIGEGQNCT